MAAAAAAAYLSTAEWASVAEAALGQAVRDVVHFTLTPLNALGGFMGDHQLATVKVRDASDSERVLNFFLKAFPNGLDSQTKLLQQTNGFTKEVDILNAFFPLVRSSLRDGGQDMEWTCRCLFTRPDVIVLEDLIAQGFRTLDNRRPISYKHIQHVLTNLANLHAASVVFEESRREEPRQPFRLDAAFPELMKETFFRHGANHPGTPFMQSSVEMLFALVEHLHGKEALRSMKKDLRAAMGLTYELNKPSDKFRNVMCHGDVKRDNIFFRYDAEEEPIEARLVDFQVLRYTPPANDVMSFLHISTDRRFREKHFHQALRHYHDRLALNLKRQGLDAEKVLLSWDSFRESCEVYKLLGVTIAVCYMPFLYFKPEHIEHIFSSSERFEHFFLYDRIPETMNAFQTDDFFRKMVTDIVNELIEECTVNKIHLRY